MFTPSKHLVWGCDNAIKPASYHINSLVLLASLQLILGMSLRNDVSLICCQELEDLYRRQSSIKARLSSLNIFLSSLVQDDWHFTL